MHESFINPAVEWLDDLESITQHMESFQIAEA